MNDNISGSSNVSRPTDPPRRCRWCGGWMVGRWCAMCKYDKRGIPRYDARRPRSL